MAKVGDTFKSAYADGYVQFTAIEPAGDKAFICEADDVDWGHLVKAFTVAEIDSALGWQRVEDASTRKNDEFWASVKPGEIYHYDNAFGEFVRCRVTDDRQFQPIALVGNWSASDVKPHSYHARHVLTGTGVWRPHVSCVYEVALKSQDGKPTDPRVLAPVVFGE